MEHILSGTWKIPYPAHGIYLNRHMEHILSGTWKIPYPAHGNTLSGTWEIPYPARASVGGRRGWGDKA